MKVLQILPELESGGVERGTLEIARYLVQQQHESLVVSNGGRMVAQLENQGSRHFTMPVHRKSLASLFQIAPLRRLLEREQPGILHIRSRVPGWIAWLAWRGVDPARRPRLVSTVHGFNSVNYYSAIMTRGERVIAVSHGIRDYVLKNYPAIRPEIIRVIPRGVEPSEYPRGFRPADDWLHRWRQDFPQLTDKTVLLLPGRITRLKGHEDFLRLISTARKLRPDIHGVIVGGAHPRKQEYFADVQKMTRRMGLSANVTFTGQRADLKEIMAVSEIVFSLSTKPESFGRTTLEAMAMGRKVIGYDHGGVGEQLKQHFPMGLVPPGDFTRLTTVTGQVLNCSVSPEPLCKDYTLAQMCSATLAIYCELSRDKVIA